MTFFWNITSFCLRSQDNLDTPAYAIFSEQNNQARARMMKYFIKIQPADKTPVTG
jgi:hypothetical protein